MSAAVLSEVVGSRERARAELADEVALAGVRAPVPREFVRSRK